ncbi:MAG: methionine ABC transporter permease [Corynebacterium casei]|uniref:ABC transporter, inner membrane subunit n=2 Tax=Corynebacterium casei TaxID=160386 RepID=G7HY55_9CORY|nr:methionine ABC transporter permease [Corynebacterium casei]AHI21124.1 ABC transporter permease [Corynebacterium casei LMG S-19264]MDN5705435.1 ABC transporter permease [Corynebacterium casei]MDN5728044.1 ABC transporter permease [Corynebacterium casei]MDN5739643.1 ABC transporter permease [Corynebacterium casei]MDN5783125.1 ABC transporter permease [Corynebacterium casei]
MDLTDIFDTRVGFEKYGEAAVETLYMVGVSLFVGTLFGVVLGVILVLNRPGGLRPVRWLYEITNFLVNTVRSLPFIILMVAILPFTRFIVGSSIGTTAALVPLTLFIAPFMARLIEQSVLDVDSGILEAAESMGATTWQTIRYFLLPEAKAGIILALTTSTITLISATAMAGTIGGGGVGDLAISYGYQQFDTVAIVITVIILIVVVQGIQAFGTWWARRVRNA